MNIKSLALSICALTLSAQTNAALVVDQESTFVRSGSISGTAAQSFLPSVNSISGIDAFLVTINTIDGSNISNITATLYEANGPEDFTYASNPALASASLLLDTTNNSSRYEGWAELRWNPVTVIPESWYIIALTSDNGSFSVSASTNTDFYSRGQYLETFSLHRDYFDLNFKTYYDDNLTVPLPATAWLFGSGLLGLVSIARRKTL